MSKIKHFPVFGVLMLMFSSCIAQSEPNSGQPSKTIASTIDIKTGASQWETYLPLIQNKKIGVVANQTSMVNGVHLIDFLLSKGITVEKVFAPEHGFRGEAGPGDHVDSGKDPETGLPVISLYGSKRKPAPADIDGLDYIVFDIQDAGARFYTYISTLHYVMEACAESDIPVMIFDRPNPNGFYIDGPVLDTAFRSFVGNAPIPVVHGLTLGEYAMMANGEGWLKNEIKCRIQVIAMPEYRHDLLYDLPVRPSPNLPNSSAIYLYPSLCFFEGTAVSVGRGTAFPFQMIGFPGYKEGNYSFTPREIPGVIKDPPYENVKCQGILLTEEWKSILLKKQLNLNWLVDMYNAFPEKNKFFNNFFDKLAGSDQLRKQIIAGESLDAIRASWIPGLEKYKKIRLKYLLYPD